MNELKEKIISTVEKDREIVGYLKAFTPKNHFDDVHWSLYNALQSAIKIIEMNDRYLLLLSDCLKVEQN